MYCGFSMRIDKVANGFCLGKLHPTVSHGTKREFSRRGQARIEGDCAVDNRAQQYWRSMTVQLYDILSSERVRRLEKANERFIEGLAALGIDEGLQAQNIG